MGVEKEWEDVLNLIRKKHPLLHEEEESESEEASPMGQPAQKTALQREALQRFEKEFKRPLMEGRPVYGPRLNLPGLVHEPVAKPA